MITKRLMILMIFFCVFRSHYIFGDEDAPKSYFVQPIEVVCDYPFNDTTKWAITCRVWGLLKYYHLNVTAGKFDWDQVLIDRIEKINEAETSEQVNAELIKMIQIAGEYEMTIDTTWNDSLNMNVNLCWLDHSFINDTIRQTLKEIASLAIEQPSRYIKPHEDMDVVPYPNEKEYDVETILTFEYRLLALFRYWNVIYYFHPYKYLMDQSWDESLMEFIPLFMEASDVQSYHKVVDKLTTRLNDGHGFTTISTSPRFNPFDFKYITMVGDETVVRILPKESMLDKGDIILNLEGKDIQSVRDSIGSLIASSNKYYTDNAVNCWIYHSIWRGGKFTVLRNQQLITINRYDRFRPLVSDSTSYYPVSPEFGYVNLNFLKTSDIPDMMDSMKNYKGIIFDLRNYPLKLIAWDLISYLNTTQEYRYALTALADLSHSGAFYKYDCFTKCPDELWHARKKFNGKIVVLINAATGSMAETWAMMFRIHGATLIGTPTAGANGNVVRFPLPWQITIQYSGLGFYYPDGTQMQRTGIIPDIEVYPTMDDIMAGRDEVLEAAISFLNSN